MKSLEIHPDFSVSLFRLNKHKERPSSPPIEPTNGSSRGWINPKQTLITALFCSKGECKIPIFEYCVGIAVLVILQTEKADDMATDKLHRHRGRKLSTTQAHCSGKEQCAFLMSKSKQCSLLQISSIPLALCKH